MTDEEKALEFLEKNISDGDTFAKIVDVFEEMTKIDIENESGKMLLFETGVFGFYDGAYMLHLVRQTEIPEEDEFYQITVDVLYDYEEFADVLDSGSDGFWNEFVDNDFFEEIRSGKAYEILKDQKSKKVMCYLDET